MYFSCPLFPSWSSYCHYCRRLEVVGVPLSTSSACIKLAFTSWQCSCSCWHNMAYCARHKSCKMAAGNASHHVEQKCRQVLEVLPQRKKEIRCTAVYQYDVTVIEPTQVITYLLDCGKARRQLPGQHVSPSVYCGLL